ncbi:hypothetical protein Tco_0661906 [Tanacetum coccineum]
MVLSVWNLRESDKNEVKVDYNFIYGQTRLDTYNLSPIKKYTIVELEDEKPVPNSRVAKQLMLEWNGNVGESSVANEMGKNNMPSQFDAVGVRLHKKFYNSLGRVPNRCSVV